MWIVTLDAAAFGLRPFGCVPEAIDPAMGTRLPIPVDGAVALGAEKLGLVPRNLVACVIDKGIPVGEMVTIEASGVDSVIQLDFPMLGQGSNRFRRGRNDAMTLHATVLEPRRRIYWPEFGLPNRCCIDGPRGDRFAWNDGTDERKGIHNQHGSPHDEDHRHPVSEEYFHAAPPPVRVSGERSSEPGSTGGVRWNGCPLCMGSRPCNCGASRPSGD